MQSLTVRVQQLQLRLILFFPVSCSVSNHILVSLICVLLSFFLPINLPGPSEVRDLRCNFDRNDSEKLNCTWTAPEYPNGNIQYYRIKLLNNKELIYQNQTEHEQFELRSKFKHDEIYEVSVNAVAHAWSPTVATKLRYIALRKSAPLSKNVKYEGDNQSESLLNCDFPTLDK